METKKNYKKPEYEEIKMEARLLQEASGCTGNTSDGCAFQ